MNVQAIYHWWGTEEDSPPYSNLRSPILMSIATLRGVNPDIDIRVLDMSDNPTNDWKHFKEKLNFKTEKKPSFHYQRLESKVKGYKHLSRIPDIQWTQDTHTLMYVDSDVFWFKNPLPLMKDANKFCFDGWNTGFFYYSISSEVLEFLGLVDIYTNAAIHSVDIRKIFTDRIGYDAWYEVWDEMILPYIVSQRPDLVNLIPPEEHMAMRDLAYTNPNLVKMFHGNGTIMSNPLGKNSGERDHSRGLFMILFKEFYDNAMKVIDENDLQLMFTQEELDHYLPMQFSLLENRDRVLNTKIEDGHYDIQKCL